MTRILLTLALILAPVVAFAQSVGGVYTAQGRNANGSSYTGTVWIDDAGESFNVDWEVGISAYSGIGTIQGNVLVVDWGDRWPIYYVILPNGELHGTWSNGAALERLIPR
jgi:hypothetical protein